MKQAFFITGTDTGVGKTQVACQLMRQYAAQGLTVVGMKPIAAGCALVNGEWVNEDVEKLIAASNVTTSRKLMNPYCFNPAIAPHLAAAQVGVEIQIDVIQQAFHQLASLADVVIVEGAGGLLVPLNQQKTIADLVAALDIPMILVVGIKLGCINHTLLTLEAIKARQLKLYGWVANQIDPDMLFAQDNIATIATALQSNCLFRNEWQPALRKI
ncbi:MAG: dethiobiotin synthase [Methylophilaceae bacterium]